MYKKILFPTDGSSFSNNAVEHALSLASKYDAQIIVLTVVENGFMRSMPLDGDLLEVEELLKNESNENLEAFKKIAEINNPNIDIVYRMEEGVPAKSIIDVSNEEDVDLIVIASSGKSNFDKFLMGSVADKVAKSASCPVLIIH